MDLRTHVVDLLFIVNHMHQKIKALFFGINFDYYKKFCKKKMFSFLSFFLLSILKEKRKIDTKLNRSSKFNKNLTSI